MGNLGLSELLVIFIVALVVIGPKRLPEVARALGQAARAFQDALHPPQQTGQTDQQAEPVAKTGSDRV